jgi:hypothetical protein
MSLERASVSLTNEDMREAARMLGVTWTPTLNPELEKLYMKVALEKAGKVGEFEALLQTIYTAKRDALYSPDE